MANWAAKRSQSPDMKLVIISQQVDHWRQQTETNIRVYITQKTPGHSQRISKVGLMAISCDSHGELGAP